MRVRSRMDRQVFFPETLSRTGYRLGAAMPGYGKARDGFIVSVVMILSGARGYMWPSNSSGLHLGANFVFDANPRISLI